MLKKTYERNTHMFALLTPILTPILTVTSSPQSPSSPASLKPPPPPPPPTQTGSQSSTGLRPRPSLPRLPAQVARPTLAPAPGPYADAADQGCAHCLPTGPAGDGQQAACGVGGGQRGRTQGAGVQDVVGRQGEGAACSGGGSRGGAGCRECLGGRVFREEGSY